MTTTDERESALEYLRMLFRFLARTQRQGRSRLYTLLSETVAADDSLLQLLLDTPACCSPA